MSSLTSSAHSDTVHTASHRNRGQQLKSYVHLLIGTEECHYFHLPGEISRGS